MTIYEKKIITIITSFISLIGLIGGSQIGTKVIDKAKKLNAIRTCRSKSIEYRKSMLIPLKDENKLKTKEKEEDLIKIVLGYKNFNKEKKVGLRINYKNLITYIPISKYQKLIYSSKKMNKIEKFDLQILTNTYLYNCIYERNLLVFTSREVKAKTIDNNNN